VDAAAVTSLIVASLDLQLVRLVRGAMATPAGSGEPASGLGPAPTIIERRFRIEPDPQILPRQRIEPEPRVEPRQVVHLPDRFEPSNPNDYAPPPSYECYRPHTRSPIEPPWKVLPWEEAACPPPPPKIKVVTPPPDVIHKGSLIDFFI
jgi:hypothetical protein